MKGRLKSRRGVLLLEAVISLMLLAAMAGAAFPLISHVSRILTDVMTSLRLAEDGLFAAEYMTSRIRGSISRSPRDGGWQGARYAYYDYNQYDLKKKYTFAVEDRVWYLILYDGLGKQPITGGHSQSPTYEVGMGAEPYFTVEPGGLVHVGYQMQQKTGGAQFEVKTAVLPLYDYFLQGEAYE